MGIEGLSQWEYALYLEGKAAREKGRPKGVCPFFTNQMHRRCLWLAGWNDTDLEIARLDEVNDDHN